MHTLRAGPIGLSTETVYMIGMAMEQVQHQIRVQRNYGDVRELIAIFQKLDNCAASAEVELADL